MCIRDSLNTEAAWAIVVFIIIMYYKIKTNGILAYLKGLLDPIFLMAPINVCLLYTSYAESVINGAINVNVYVVG